MLSAFDARIRKKIDTEEKISLLCRNDFDVVYEKKARILCLALS
jgi:hypothetical protein